MCKSTTQPPSGEQAIFLQEMQGVQPLRHKVKAPLRKGSIDKASLNARRLAAEKQPSATEAGFSSHNVPQIGPHDPCGFKRPGIQDGVYRKLRLGRYEIEARLDLHRRNLQQAELEIKRFLKECLEHDLRTVLILPGKGDRDQLAPAILKSHLAHWLKDLEQVQAYHTAQPQHGGAGAFYVLLKKSERKKQQAREQFSKGRL